MSAESLHPAHKKSIGVPHLSTRNDSRPFNLIWAHPEWMNLGILGNFRFLKDVRIPAFRIPQKKMALKTPRFVRVPFVKILQRSTVKFENPQICPGPIFKIPATKNRFWKIPNFQTPPARRRRRNSQIQIQAPPNTPRDEMLPQGNPCCWFSRN